MRISLIFLFLVYVRNLVILFLVKISAIVETAIKIIAATGTEECMYFWLTNSTFYYEYLTQWLVCAFFWRFRWPLLDIICLSCALLCAPVRSCAFLFFPKLLLCIWIILWRSLFVNQGHSCAFVMAPNQPSFLLCPNFRVIIGYLL